MTAQYHTKVGDGTISSSEAGIASSMRTPTAVSLSRLRRLTFRRASSTPSCRTRSRWDKGSELTLGAKVERDTYAGWGLQPTARVMWALVPKRQHVWAAVSRALHTPSLGDVSGRYNYASFVGQGGLPVVVGALGNPDYQSEQVVNVEAGYRLELGPIASIDVSGIRRAATTS